MFDTCLLKNSLFLYLILFFSLGTVIAHASTINGTIDPQHAYAWSNNDGWLNFGATNGNVRVTDTLLTGYVWDTNTGWINLAPSQGGVTNDSEGHLGGYAWGTGTGWINFSGVVIDVMGRFHGTATGSIIGTLTFDCTNCWVQTDWRSKTVRNAIVQGGGGTYTPPTPVATNTTPVTSVIPAIPVIPRTTPTPLPPVPPRTVQPTTRPPVSHRVMRNTINNSAQNSSDSLPRGTDRVTPPSTCIGVQNSTIVLKPTQCGRLDYVLPGIGIISLEIPAHVAKTDLVFEIIITTQRENNRTSANTTGDAFEITAHERISKKPIHAFSQPLKITFPIPTSLQSKSHLQLYTKEQLQDQWVGVSNAVFGHDTVTVYVNHLSLFMITASDETQTSTTTEVASHIVVQESRSKANSTDSICKLYAPLDPYLTTYIRWVGCTLVPLIIGTAFLIFLFLIWIVSRLFSNKNVY